MSTLDTTYPSSQSDRTGPGSSNRVEHALDFAVFVSAAIFFGYVSLRRLIAQDEGFYVLAARLVSEGKLPYLDFFYPQMPLLPYIYGAWMKLTSNSWYSARLLSALLCAGSGWLLFRHLRSTLGASFAVIGCLFFMSSSMVFAECTTTKSYASSLFLLLSAFCLADPGGQARSPAKLFWAGLILGIAVNTRAPLALALPVFVLGAWQGRKDERYLNVSRLLAGFALACLPSLLLLLADPASFWFNNLGYHFERAGEGGSRELAERSRRVVARVVFGLRTSARFDLLHYPILVYSSLLCAAAALARRRLPGFAFLVGLALFAGSFLPVPTYLQYFVVTEPFLLIAILGGCKELCSKGRFARGAVLATLAGLLLVRAAAMPEDLKRYSSTGEHVIGITRGKAFNWKIRNVEEAGKLIDRLNPQREPVMAMWPGYLLSSDSPPFPGTENHFGVKFLEKNPDSQRLSESYRIRSWEQLLEAIERREPRLVVYFRMGKDALPNKLDAAGYRIAGRVADILIFDRSADRAPPAQR